MNKFTHSLSVSLCLLPLAWTLPAAAEDRFDGIEVTTQKLTDKIHMLTGPGGNISLPVGTDGILMINDQYAPMAPKIKAAIAELGDGEPAYLLNTHFHGDHTGDNTTSQRVKTEIARGKTLGQIVAAGQGDARAIRTLHRSYASAESK
jgi:glyoxylase-like metal-dependent hydrolase (beta-lactamase superfamily II)